MRDAVSIILIQILSKFLLRYIFYRRVKLLKPWYLPRRPGKRRLLNFLLSHAFPFSLLSILNSMALLKWHDLHHLAQKSPLQKLSDVGYKTLLKNDSIAFFKSFLLAQNSQLH